MLTVAELPKGAEQTETAEMPKGAELPKGAGQTETAEMPKGAELPDGAASRLPIRE